MKKCFIALICILLVCGCSKKDDENPNTSPTPTPTPAIDEEKEMLKLSELLPESVNEISLEIETSTETITIEFKEEEIEDVLKQLKNMEVSAEFEAYAGAGAKEYRLMVTDDAGIVHEITEQGNVLRMADGTKTGPMSDEGLIHGFVMNMDWVVSITDYEMLTPLRIETDEYIITCSKGNTSVYDLAYLKDAGFDPFEQGFQVTIDGTDQVLTEMPDEGDYLLILTKGNASYQLKVTSTVK